MATGWSTAAANAILDAYFRNVAPSLPTQVWVKLHIGAPGAAGTSNPAANTTRKQGTFASAASAGAIANTGALTWSAVGATEVYTHFTVWDASSAGTFLYSGTVTNGSVTSGDDFTAPIGALTGSIPIAS